MKNYGALTLLATGVGADAGLDVIIGGCTGSITNQAPEPASLALVGLALAGAFLSAKRKRA